MGRKEEYKLQNEQFMQTLRTEADVHELPCGILYKVLEEGTGAATPRSNSVVSVHYKGTLINGREFDNSWKRNCPEAFRLNEVIEGWQIALQKMRVGDPGSSTSLIIWAMAHVPVARFRLFQL